MAGVDELDLDAGNHGHWPVVADRLQPRQRPRSIERGIKRQGGRVLAVSAAIGAPGVFFLQMCGVGQHQRAQLPRTRRTENPPLEALRDEPGQIAAVVEMGVCQHDRVDFGRVDRQRRPIAKAEVFQALKQSAVDEHSMVAEIEQVLRSSDCARRTEERESRHPVTILDRMVRALCRRSVPRLLAILFCVLCAVATSAQQKSLTLDDIYSPAANVNFSGHSGASLHVDRRRPLRLAAPAERFAAR